MKKNSIFFKINLLFTAALIATIVAFGIVLKTQKQKINKEEFFKVRIILKEIRKNRSLSRESADFLKAKAIKGKDKEFIIKTGSKRVLITRPKWRIRVSKIKYNGENYYLINSLKGSYLLKFKQDKSRIWFTLLLFLAIILFLIAIYWLIRKSLKPLKELEADITNYAKGAVLEPKFINSNDEVAKINNTFYDYAAKAASLSKSRELFIRNIFHELNTPITKGKILTEIVEESKTKQMLESIFGRLESLIKELYKVEQITSKSYKLNPKNIPIIELIDSAKELLYIDNIEHNITNQKLNCDYNAMVIVFKNLIDNGIKYGKNFKIECNNGNVCFLSRGEKLSNPLSHYTKAFTGTGNSSGLGLYIVQEILGMHKMELKYNYDNGVNSFCISNKS